MGKAKKPDFMPNPYEGFRATTRESHGFVEVYMSITGNKGTVEDVMIARYQADIQGYGKADMLFPCVQMIAIALNGGMPIEELAHVWNAVIALSQKYRVEIPKDWVCMAISGLDFSDHQIIYVKESTREVVVVEPDAFAEATTLEDIVFQGRQNIVAQGRGEETPKIQHQPDSRKKKSS